MYRQVLSPAIAGMFYNRPIFLVGIKNTYVMIIIIFPKGEKNGG